MGAIFNKNDDKVVSPSRTYVAVVFNGNFTSVSFHTFTLPEQEEIRGTVEDAEGNLSWSYAYAEVANHNGNASWWFLNKIDGFACILDTFPVEYLANTVDRRVS
jgi:hypothetical protein